MLRLSVLFCTLALSTLVVVGCEVKSEDNKTAGSSQIGESCDRTSDCAASLGCFSGICQPAESKVTPNGKECKAIQCDAAADCCTNAWKRGSMCDTYDTQCAASPTSSYCVSAQGPECVCKESQYSCVNNLCKALECTTPADCCTTRWSRSSSCTSYETNCAADPVTYASYCTTAAGPSCVCNDTIYNYGCVNNVCTAMTSCTTDTNCTSTLSPKCSEGHCVACIAETDCDTGSKCVGNRCVAPQCVTNSDCPAYYECQADNTCKRVGCATDRECMTSLKSYLATCNKSASPVPTCEESCERDAQCKTTANPLRLCSNGRCMDAGCETDEECKIQLKSTTVTTVTTGIEYKCRDVAAQ